jgi:hypothetical protein
MLGTANGAGIHESVHPWTTSTRSRTSTHRSLQAPRFFGRRQHDQPLWRGANAKESPQQNANPYASIVANERNKHKKRSA